jgi:RNA polymerase sigma-70 factor (ECF subfamily)
VLAAIAPRILRFGLRVCANATDADDVLQDTLLTVARRLGEFEGRSSLLAWAFVIARRACLRHRRGLKNAPPMASDATTELPDPAPNPEVRASTRELVLAVDRALRALPVDAREVLALRDIEGLSAAESAAVLAITPEALKSRLHRARVGLRDRLRPLLEATATEPKADCPDILARWSQKLEGELTELDCTKLEAHVQGCAACGPACSALKRALELCHMTAATPVPVEVQAQVKAAVAAWTRERAAR